MKRIFQLKFNYEKKIAEEKIIDLKTIMMKLL